MISEVVFLRECLMVPVPSPPLRKWVMLSLQVRRQHACLARIWAKNAVWRSEDSYSRAASISKSQKSLLLSSPHPLLAYCTFVSFHQDHRNCLQAQAGQRSGTLPLQACLGKAKSYS